MADREHLGGVTNTTLHFEADGTMHVEEKQDCEPVLDLNARMRNERFSAVSASGDFTDVANVPVVVLLQWSREAGLGNNIYCREFEVIMEKKLQLPEYAKFLTAPKVRDAHIIMRGIR